MLFVLKKSCISEDLTLSIFLVISKCLYVCMYVCVCVYIYIYRRLSIGLVAFVSRLSRFSSVSSTSSSVGFASRLSSLVGFVKGKLRFINSSGKKIRHSARLIYIYIYIYIHTCTRTRERSEVLLGYIHTHTHTHTHIHTYIHTYIYENTGKIWGPQVADALT